MQLPRWGRGTAALLALAFVGALGADARAANPLWPPLAGADHSDPASWPDDPGYDGQWNFWSWVPAATLDTIRPEEATAGTGIHADRAWELTIGRDDVLIAVLDSGAFWEHRDLVNKWYLNAAELPAPDAGCPGGDGVTHDANGDGIFNVQDYTTALGHDQPVTATICDTRLSDDNANGILDPQDLILLFSDGIDGDANGYIDDICGWDFLWDDNDAYDDTRFGHGTGEARDSCSETNNAIDDAGVCPLCRVMPVRSGDSFVVDVNDFALATIFAVDSGALVVQEALGSINNTALAMAALEYAWDSGVVVVASAADEMSRHHNFPGSNNHTLYVHAIRMDNINNDFNNSTTFLNFNNCTNYGGNLALSTPGTGCSSEATGKTSGIVGLLFSYARDAGLTPPLTPGEVRQLLVMTVFDIDVPEGLSPLCDTDADCGGGERCVVLYDGNLCLDLCDAITGCADEENFDCRNPGDGIDTCLPLKFPSRPGWDQFFGYGRPNVRSALDALAADLIPPEVDVVSPLWFDYVPASVGTVDIVGSVSSRYPTYDFVVEWARGIEPDEASFTAVAMMNGLSAPTSGVLGSIPVAEIAATGAVDVPSGDPNEFTVTVRVRATAHGAGVSATADVSGEFRKTFSVHGDPDLLPGFPIWMGASGESSPKLVDLDGDGAREIVIATADGLVHAISNAGGSPVELPGFPAELLPLEALDPAGAVNHLEAAAYAGGGVDATIGRGTVTSVPCVGDLDGDGDDEIVVASHDAWLYVFDSAGAMVAGFPVSPDPGLSLVTERDRELDFGFAIGSPALGDLDGNGDLEIVAPALDGHVYVWHHDGTADPGFPVELVDLTVATPVHRRVVSTPAIGDLDRDGILDIVIGSSEGYAGDTQGRVYAIHGDGAAHAGGPFLPGWPIPVYSGTVDVLPFVGQGVPNAPALADVDGDGTLEVAIETIGDTGTIYLADQSLRSPTMAFKYAIMENYAHGPGSDTIDRPLLTLINNGSFGDLNGDGQVDFVKGGAGFGFALAFASGGQRAIFDHMLGAWDLADTVSTGGVLEAAPFPAWPRRVQDWMFFMNPAIADLSGDGLPEVINGNGAYLVDAFDHEGVSPPGWPKFTAGWVASSPAVGDVDGDGDRDVVVSTRNGYLFAWSTPAGARGGLEWESFHHDLHNTGNYEVVLSDDLPAPDGGADGGVGDAEDMPRGCGCGCAVIGGHEGAPRLPPAPLLVGALALLALALRRGRAR